MFTDNIIGLTNFVKEDYPTYKEAIRVYTARYGNHQAYYVRFGPMDCPCPNLSDYSLYLDKSYKKDGEDSSKFWQVFDEVRKYIPTTFDKLHNKTTTMKEKTQEEKYKDAQKAFIDMTGLKVGSRVRILRKSEHFQFGWTASWNPSMKSSGEFIIDHISSDSGFRCKGDSFYYPFFILEVIPHPLPDPIPLANGDYIAKFKADGSISVGCQNISYEKLKEIYDTATSVVNR